MQARVPAVTWLFSNSGVLSSGLSPLPLLLVINTGPVMVLADWSWLRGTVRQISGRVAEQIQPAVCRTQGYQRSGGSDHDWAVRHWLSG